MEEDYHSRKPVFAAVIIGLAVFLVFLFISLVGGDKPAARRLDLTAAALQTTPLPASATFTPLPSFTPTQTANLEATSGALSATAAQLLITPTLTPTPDARPHIAIYLFWGDGCPHCAAARPVLEEIDASSDLIDLNQFEVWHNKDNQILFSEMAGAYGFKARYVPTIFIGTRHWEGYSDQVKAEIQAAVNTCLANGCIDPGDGIIPEAAPASPENSDIEG